jgi:hypothetical protein
MSKAFDKVESVGCEFLWKLHLHKHCIQITRELDSSGAAVLGRGGVSLLLEGPAWSGKLADDGVEG